MPKMLFGGNELYKHVLQKKEKKKNELKGWKCRTYFYYTERQSTLWTITAFLY